MIRISEKDKAQIGKILSDYKNKSFEKTLLDMSPILKNYHQLEPKRLGKRLLESLFSSWLQKENEAIVHYYTLCHLVDHYHYPAEQLDHEVPCGALGRESIKGSMCCLRWNWTFTDWVLVSNLVFILKGDVHDRTTKVFSSREGSNPPAPPAGE